MADNADNLNQFDSDYYDEVSNSNNSAQKAANNLKERQLKELREFQKGDTRFDKLN
jgi:hypothetical protein